MNTSPQENGETVSNRQVGYGLVFGVPKSLSIFWQSQPIWWLRRSQGRRWMKRWVAMEAEMQCKVRKGGLDEDRRTGEMLYSEFYHRDSRPINGLIPDKGYFQEYFHTLLARGLIKFGYKLRRTDRGWHQWEMACITDS